MSNTHSLDLLLDSLSPIKVHLDDPDVTEIMINGENDVWIEKAGRLEQIDVLAITAKNIESIILVLASLEQKSAEKGTSTGIVDARIDGFRFAGILPPTASKGPCLSIRKHSIKTYTLDDLAHRGAMTSQVVELLRAMVKERKNVLVVGGTSSGKTTVLNAMIQEMPVEHRVITIEDTRELKVSVPNNISLESNTQRGITPRDLVRTCLRMRPDRILLGEVRGGEAYDLLAAANTGHDGVLATLHANSALKGLSRFENLVLQSGIDWPHQSICKEIADVFDYVVFVQRTASGQRGVAEILHLTGFDMNSQKYEFSYLFQQSSLPIAGSSIS